MTTSELRILHVSEVHWGGVVSLLDQFVDAQRDAGHEVHLLAPPGPPAWTGQHVHRWDLDRGRPATLLIAWRQLRRTVREVQPDVIHLHSFFAGLLGRLPFGLSWRGRMPVVYQPHAWSTDLFSRKSLSTAVAFAERFGGSRTDLMVANCRDEVEHGRRIGVRTPSRVIGVAVDLEHFAPATEAQRTHERAARGLGEQGIALLLGRIGWQKAQDLLLPAWEAQHPGGALLALVGPGEPESVAPLAPTQWGGTVRAFPATTDARGWLATADVLVLASRYEGFPVVVAEAMAMGVPVVSTAVNGLREAVEEGGSQPAGAVVELGDMPALIDAIGVRLADPDLRYAEAKSARARAEQMFDPDDVARRLESAYREAGAVAVVPRRG